TTIANVAGNSAARANFCQKIADFIQTNDLDGWDLDWEYPSGSTEKNNHELLLKDMRTALDAKEAVMGKKLEISVAVGGESGHLAYMNSSAVQYVDFVSIMAYDEWQAVQHSSYDFAVSAVTLWSNFGVPKSKIMLGVPFYGRNAEKLYSEIAASNPSEAYNSTTDYYNGSYYNARPTLEKKTDYIMEQGGLGITIWELCQDRMENDPYSLLGAIYNKMQDYACSTPQPNLGSDQSICGASSVTLNSGVSAGAGLTFSWKKNGTTINGATASTYTATSAGTYTVTVTQGGCSKSDDIVVSGTLPAVNLGDDKQLCDPPTITLDAGVSGSGISYVWKKNGTTISGATSKTYTVTEPGTYEVTVSAASCGSQSDNIIITSTLLDVTGGSTCGPGTVELKVNSTGGTYEWYASSTGGSVLHTGPTYTPTVTSTKTYYVKDASSVSGSVGGTATFSTPDYDVSASEKMTFNTSVNNITINSVDVYVHEWESATNIVLSIENSSGTLIGSAPAISHNNSQTGSATKITIPVNITIPQAGEGYKMYFSSGTAGLRYTNTGFPYTESSGAITLTGGIKYYNNIQFSAGSSSCAARTPVVATVNTSGCEVTSLFSEDLTGQLNVEAYPNPTSDIVYFKVNLPTTSTLKIDIYNTQGEAVINIPEHVGKTGIQDFEIQTTELPEGIYFCKIRINNQVITKRITIIK
ncbi:MAG TPA: glycosyl hydrolase family 18 protein, partial [Cytophagaceae bacterium]